MWFSRFYRILMLSYSPGFRRDHGRDAAGVFAEACLECWRNRQYTLLLARLVSAVVEVPLRGIAERAHAWRLPDRQGALADLPADLRATYRSLRRTPAFTITAILTMTIGITLNTAMFTAFSAIGLRGWPGVDADRVVVVTAAARQDSDIRTGLDLDDLRQFQRSRSLTKVAASQPAFQYIATEPRGSASFVYGRFVTADFFDVIGLPMARGRAFTLDEDRDGAAAPVVVISHALWRRLFAEEESVIGRSLYFGTVAYEIVGVLPEQWRGEQPYRDDVWLPLHAIRVLDKENRLFAQGTSQCCVRIVGRLADHATRDSASEELSVLSRPRRAIADQPSWRVVVSGTARFGQMHPAAQATVSAVLLVITALVLLLTGANVTHLQLARAAARAREVRTRLALGASRFRIVRQLTTEALALAAASGILALGLVTMVSQTLMRVAEMPVIDLWRPDVTVFLYCAVVSVAMSVTFGLMPAVRSTDVSLAHNAGHTATPRRLRGNLLLLTVQVALSVTLLTGAALLTRALSHATRADAGFVIDGLTVVTVQPGRLGDGARLRSSEFRDPLFAALASSTLPTAASVDVLPLVHPVNTMIQRAGDTSSDRFRVAYAPMSSDAFEVFGIPIVEGRLYDDGSNDEAVINQAAARRLWPNESPVGKGIILDGQRRVVTGVVRDVHFQSRAELAPTLHLPSNPARSATMFVLRAAGPAAAAQVRAIVRSLDAHASVTIRSLPGILEAQLEDERAGSQAAWAGGLLALALATFGVFGVFVYVAEERRRELGIRIALGAQPRDVLRTLFQPARRAVASGLSVGLVVSLVLAKVGEGALYGLSPFDPVAFAIVAALIAAAAMVATVVPARRALSVDPVVILKTD